MKIAVAIIKADGIVEETEKQILLAYANEMQIPVCNLDEQYDVAHAIEEFAKNSTPQTQRSVFLELLALAFADNNYAIEEKALIQQIADAFQLDQAFIKRTINLVDAYVATYMSLISLIEKGE